MKKSFFLIIFLPLYAFSQAPKFSNDFLNIGVGARGLAMGGAASASSHSVMAAYWNPASLVRTDAKFQVGLQHAEYYSGIGSYDYIGFGKTLDAEKSSFGSISVIRLGIDKIPNTLRLRGPDGSIDYSRLEEFSVADYAFLVSYGKILKGGPISLGGSLKVIHRSFGSFAKSWGFGMDLGFVYHKEKFTFSLMGRDITSTFNAYSFTFTEEEKAVLQQSGNTIPKSSVEYTLPKLIAGFAYPIKLSSKMGLLAELDVEFNTDGTSTSILGTNKFNIDPRIGFELDVKKIVFVRIGVSDFQTILKDDGSNQETFSVEPAAGVGLRIGKIGLDYALTSIGQTGITEYSHYFSLLLNF